MNFLNGWKVNILRFFTAVTMIINSLLMAAGTVAGITVLSNSPSFEHGAMAVAFILSFLMWPALIIEAYIASVRWRVLEGSETDETII